MKTFYEILELKNCSSMEEVRRAYRSLALKHHPDRGGDQERMKEINAAYEYLVRNKHLYDASLAPRRPQVVRNGFTIIVGGVNGFSWQFEGGATTGTGSGSYSFFQ